jgi:hypothetical protein
MNADLHERRMKMLGDYAEMALALAHDLHRTALNAEGPEEKVRCAVCPGGCPSPTTPAIVMCAACAPTARSNGAGR